MPVNHEVLPLSSNPLSPNHVRAKDIRELYPFSIKLIYSYNICFNAIGI